jgi:hypothetical protein
MNYFTTDIPSNAELYSGSPLPPSLCEITFPKGLVHLRISRDWGFLIGGRSGRAVGRFSGFEPDV